MCLLIIVFVLLTTTISIYIANIHEKQAESEEIQVILISIIFNASIAMLIATMAVLMK